MGYHCFTLFCLAFVTGLAANPLYPQDKEDHRYEVGLRFSGINFDGFNAFSAIYKKRLTEDKYRRISGTFGGLGISHDLGRFSFSFNTGFSIGNEKRRSMGKKTTFFSGPVFSLNTGITKLESMKPNWNLQPGIGIVFGLQYDLSNHWAVNLETIPSGNIALRQFSGNDVSLSVNAGFSSNMALSLLHKF